MAKRPSSTGTPATQALHRAGIAFTTHPYEHDPAHPSYGREAAQALGLAPAQVFKTLLVRTGERDGDLVVAIVPVDAQLDLKSCAAAAGTKRATLADPALAERVTGYVVGGISPIAQRRRLPTLLDDSALTFETVYVSGGRRGLDVGLAPTDLMTVTGARAAPLARR